MRIKPIRNALIATTGVSLAMIAAVGGWALLSGSSDTVEVNLSSTGTSEFSAAPTSVAKEPMSFDRLWSVSLQEPRMQNTSQAPQPVPVKSANVAFGIKLVGTMLESSKALALFQDDRGAFDLKGVGEPLELIPAGAQVANIDSEKVTLRYEGREIPLSLVSSSMPAQQQNYINGMNTNVQDVPAEMEPESMEMPMSLMTPASPEDGIPGSEDDIFAPLPAHMNPYGLPPPEPMGANPAP